MRQKGFTLLELLITISVIAVLAGIVTFAATSIQKNSRDTARDAKVRILSDALEDYYRKNGEYPSVAMMTSTDTDNLKKNLGITDSDIFKLPTSVSANSISAANPSPTTLVYSANTTDNTKNSQCQTDVNGYCDGFTLAYVKESTGTVATVQSLHATFTAVKDDSTCDEGDTQNGTTCTHSYAGTYNGGSYTCPSGGSLSGTTCTSTYSASYSSGGGYYYCPSGGSLSGSSCVTSSTSSYGATQTQSYCKQYGSTLDKYGESHQYCQLWAYSYSCPSGGSLSGGTCTVTTTSSYGASYYSYSGYYYCSGSGSLSGTTCTNTYNASQGASYYTCPNGGVASGSTCSYTYELQG